MCLYLSEFVSPVKGGVTLQGLLSIYMHTYKHTPLCVLRMHLHVCVYTAKCLPTGSWKQSRQRENSGTL